MSIINQIVLINICRL